MKEKVTQITLSLLSFLLKTAYTTVLVYVVYASVVNQNPWETVGYLTLGCISYVFLLLVWEYKVTIETN